MEEVQLETVTEENVVSIQAALERTTKENELLREDNHDMSMQIETYIAKISELQSLVLCRPPPPPPPPPKPQEKDDIAAIEEIQRINGDLLHQVKTLVQEKCDLQTKIEELEHEISTRVEKPYPMPLRLSTEMVSTNRWIKGLLTARSPGGASVVTVSSDSQPTTTSETSIDSILPSSSSEEGYFVNVPNLIEPENNDIGEVDSPTLPAASSQFCATIEEEDDDLERIENGGSAVQGEKDIQKQPGRWSFQGLLASSRTSVGAANTFARFEESKSSPQAEQSIDAPANTREPVCEDSEPSSTSIEEANPKTDSTRQPVVQHSSVVPVSADFVSNDHIVSKSTFKDVTERDIHGATENAHTAIAVITTDASTLTIPEVELPRMPRRPQGLTIASLLMEQPWERDDDISFVYNEAKMLPRKIPSL